MPLRPLNSNPAQFSLLEANFQKAWNDVNILRDLDPGRDAENREWLAQIVLALTTSRPGKDVADLAVRQFLASVPAPVLKRRA